jgi:NAD(P)-dependent dehydrogenase (short-subunit alcohol dehydrogenase family)
LAKARYTAIFLPKSLNLNSLAKHGAHVAIIDKSAEDLEKALEEVEKQGVKALGLTSDATKGDQIDRAISEVK